MCFAVSLQMKLLVLAIFQFFFYNSVIIHFRAEIFTHLSDLNLIKFHATC